MKNPQIKPHFRVEIIEPKTVYLLSEYATHALTGSLYCQILPLLDGQHTLEEIVQKLNGQVASEHIEYVLDRLNVKGYLTDAAHSLTREAAAFWSLLNVDPQVVSDRLPQTQVFVSGIGAVDTQPLTEELQATGVPVQPWQQGKAGEAQSGSCSLRVVLGSSTNLNRLRKSLRHKSGGKGKTDRQSQASGFCEAVESYCGIYQGDEPRIQARLAELGNRAIHPARCLLFSDRQYQNREALNEKAIVDHDWIPKPFDQTQTIDWTPVWSLTEQVHKYLPTAFCYYNYRLPKEHRFCSADSNGNAAGGTLEDAVLQGFLELVERDSVALWWYNRLSRPSVDLASFNEPYLLALQAWYRSQQRELWVLDLTTDLNIPAFAALSRNVGGGEERIVAGYGAHFDAKIAILRAVTEVNQIGLAVDQQDYSTDPDSALRHWFTQATLANQPYLASAQTSPKHYTDYPQQWSDDIQQDVLTCIEVARRAGLEILVLNQTRPGIGLPVVKVIVPGLRHFWSRFGAGRLYEIPAKLRWLPAPLSEDQMNPMPMVF